MAALVGPAITGDQVRFEDDERLDKPDALALQSLIFETVIRTVGGLIGGYALPGVDFVGCAHAPSVSWNSGSKVATFGAGLLVDSGTLTSPSGSPGSRVLRHDPSLAGQTSTLDLSSYSPATQCLIWARRTYTSEAIPGVTTNLDTRKRWNTTDDAEESFSMYTRFSERVQWTAATATISGGLVSGTPTYPSGSGWFPCYRVTWSAGTPTFAPIWWMDGRISGTSFADTTALVQTSGADGASKSIGSMLYDLRNNVAYIRDNDAGTNWNTDTATYRGLKQLNEDTPVAVLAAGLISDEGSGWTVNADAVGLTLDSVAGGGTGFTITHDLWVAGGTRLAVAVTPVTGGSNSSRNFTVSSDDTNTFTVSWFNSTSGASAVVDAAGFTVAVYCVR